MGALSLDYRQTQARASFKRRSGHTTQHLLTLLVGVDAVRGGAEANSSLPATWNPVSKEDAADRARVFALSAALVWNIESVISYVRDLTRTRPATLDANLVADLRKEKNKEARLGILASQLSADEDGDALALVRAGYVWRNRVTHYDATNQLDTTVVAHLDRHSSRICNQYQGLDTSQMVERILRNETPRLKESAAIIRATGALVRLIDEKATRTCGTLNYLRLGLTQYLKDSQTGAPGKKAASLWGGTLDLSSTILVSRKSVRQ